MKGKVKLIVTDLDRTLLHTDKSVSSDTIETFAQCRKQRIKTVFATARPLHAVQEYLKLIPCDAVVFHSGAGVFCEGKRLYSACIPHETAKQLLLAFADDFPGMTLSVAVNDFLYANFDTAIHWPGSAAKQSDFTDLPHNDAEKIIAGLQQREQIETLARYLPASLYIEMSEERLGLIMHREAAEALGILPEETIAFGDDNGDLEMLKMCGIGVAVENAIPEAKAAADAVTGANDEDGVANYLQKYVL